MSDKRQDWQDGPVKVVINDEQQYSIWPIDREPPLGWREVGKSGTRDECLSYIDEVWDDLRPASVRQSAGQQGPSPEPATTDNEATT